MPSLSHPGASSPLVRRKLYLAIFWMATAEIYWLAFRSAADSSREGAILILLSLVAGLAAAAATSLRAPQQPPKTSKAGRTARQMTANGLQDHLNDALRSARKRKRMVALMLVEQDEVGPSGPLLDRKALATLSAESLLSGKEVFSLSKGRLAFLAFGVEAIDALENVETQLTRQLREQLSFHGSNLSVGIAACHTSHMSGRQLFSSATIALQRARSLRQDHYVIVDESFVAR